MTNPSTFVRPLREIQRTPFHQTNLVVPPNRRHQGVTLICGDQVELEPVRWLWPSFIPSGMFTILGGAPGCGKTTLALSWAAIISTGGPWPDGSRCAAPGDVLLWSGEDQHSVLLARFLACGGNKQRLHFVDSVAGQPFDPAHHMPLLAQRIHELKPCLLIIDPIVSAVAGDSHKSSEVRRCLAPVIELAHKTGCAVIGITHFSKGTQGRDPAERFTGSIAYVALARVALVAVKKKGSSSEDERVLMITKSNGGPENCGYAYSLARAEVAADVEGQFIQWGERIEGTAQEVLDDIENTSSEDRNASSAAEVWLRELLASATSLPSMEVHQLAQQEGINKKALEKAKSKIGIKSKRIGFGSNSISHWVLP